MPGSSSLRVVEQLAGQVLGGKAVRRHVLAPQIVESGRVRSALNCLPRVPDDTAQATGPAAPVFIFSAGWGSGSTLLQRLIISSGQVLVWGEPNDQAAPLQRLCEMVMPFRDDWPPPAHHAADHEPSALSRGWIANLAPPTPTYAHAHRAFLDTWLGQPARASSYPRWGLKEVRLTMDHARYLRWLYPEARFVFLYRDLYKCYLSCRRKRWLSVWPDYKATPIVAFAHHWRFLLEGFLDGHEDVGGRLVRYEDLIADGFAFDELCEYLDIPTVDVSLLDKKVGGRSANRHPLIYPERLILDAIAGPLRSRLGYR